jgi:exodeoxyribonuclease V beta subunit
MTAAPLDVFNCPLDGISLIEASAGTGKTWNICGLYLRLLLERGLEVQQILVVTFTNAATAELRDRIRNRIVETLARLRATGPTAPDAFVDTLLQTLRSRPASGLAGASTDEARALRLDLALQTFDEASIFTIHGFCQRALGDAPFTAGMPMALELLTDDAEMRLEVVHDFWRRRIAGRALAPTLASHLLDRGDTPRRYADLLKRQLAKPLSRLIWPAAIDSPPLLDMPAIAAAHAAARAQWLTDREAILGSVLDALPGLNGTSYKPASVASAAAGWDALLGQADALAPSVKDDKLALLTTAKLKPNKGKPPPRPHPFFDLASSLLALREAAAQSLALDRLSLLRDLLAEGPVELRQAKRARRVVAFDDMLFNLHERLTQSPGLPAALRARFPAALIDEFQDTDPLQFAIFNAIYGDASSPLFLVGDPKQAIYSFRNADLPTYLQARHQATAQYTLGQNQRSSQPLLAALNALFSANEHSFMLPGLDFLPVGYGDKPRKPLLDQTGAARAALQLWRLPRDAQGEPLTKQQARHAAASACAAEIARLIGQAQRISIGEQPLSAGDIAVLVRSHAQGGEMRRALAALGVGSVELSQASVYASPDAEDLARVLAAILEPTRERLLRAALATDLIGLDAHAIESMSVDEASLLGWVTRFAGYREQWLQRGVGVMLRALMTDLGGRDASEGLSERLLRRADGERRLTNLLHLGECLHEAAQTQSSPQALLQWLQTQRSEDRRDDASQLRLASDRHLVQIITVHKAKGLEYPVVFCPFLWDGHPGSSQSLEGSEYHDVDQQPVIDWRSGNELKPEQDAIKAQVKLSRAAENLRLVYVALTRAVHRCYLVMGNYRSNGKNPSTHESCHSLLNWLVAGQGQSPASWMQNKLKPEDIAPAWDEFAQRNAPQIGLATLPQDPPVPFQPPRPAPETLAALAPPAQIPTGWWLGSYSSLAHGARHEGAAVDHDLRLPPPDTATPLNPASLPDEDDILNFPRGPVPGECLHDVFERIDFDDPGSWPEVIATALRNRPQSLPGGDTTLAPKMITNMLRDVLNTALPGAATLAGLPRRRCLVELEFNLPAKRLSASRLAALMQQQGYPVPPLVFGSLEGYLRGFIDLVFEQGGRFHVLDWKSNHLGLSPADYGQRPMAQAMASNGYHLQYLLYTVALHRYLQQRLPDYDYEQHVGGVLYLFVRGVRPDWLDDQGQACGVYAHRPTRQTVEALSALMDSA